MYIIGGCHLSVSLRRLNYAERLRLPTCRLVALISRFHFQVPRFPGPVRGRGRVQQVEVVTCIPYRLTEHQVATNRLQRGVLLRVNTLGFEGTRHGTKNFPPARDVQEKYALVNHAPYMRGFASCRSARCKLQLLSSQLC